MGIAVLLLGVRWSWDIVGAYFLQGQWNFSEDIFKDRNQQVLWKNKAEALGRRSV